MKQLLRFLFAISMAGISSCAYNYQEEDDVTKNPPAPACDTSKTYVYADVSPIFDSKCKSCHEGGSLGPDLSDYASYNAYISSNREKFETSIQYKGDHPMPKDSPKLPDSEICTILNWIKKGTKP